ncbi:MAG TPA: hypothetical protein VF707_06455, partial [Ardenticatenaceae bacterium]
MYQIHICLKKPVLLLSDDRSWTLDSRGNYPHSGRRIKVADQRMAQVMITRSSQILADPMNSSAKA